MKPESRREAGRFLRFCLVGGLGFVADTGTLVGAVRWGGLDPAPAKALSFGVAVLVTFEFNRRWAFGAAPRGSWVSTFAAYLGVQATGFMVNWLVFTACLVLGPSGAGRLVAFNALASIAALAVNFLGARHLVFRLRQDKGGGA